MKYISADYAQIVCHRIENNGSKGQRNGLHYCHLEKSKDRFAIYTPNYSKEGRGECLHGTTEKGARGK